MGDNTSTPFEVNCLLAARYDNVIDYFALIVSLYSCHWDMRVSLVRKSAILVLNDLLAYLKWIISRFWNLGYVEVCKMIRYDYFYIPLDLVAVQLKNCWCIFGTPYWSLHFPCLVLDDCLFKYSAILQSTGVMHNTAGAKHRGCQAWILVLTKPQKVFVFIAGDKLWGYVNVNVNVNVNVSVAWS